MNFKGFSLKQIIKIFFGSRESFYRSPSDDCFCILWLPSQLSKNRECIILNIEYFSVKCLFVLLFKKLVVVNFVLLLLCCCFFHFLMILHVSRIPNDFKLNLKTTRMNDKTIMSLLYPALKPVF